MQAWFQNRIALSAFEGGFFRALGVVPGKWGEGGGGGAALGILDVMLGSGKISWPYVQKVLPENEPSSLKYTEIWCQEANIFKNCTENLEI